MTPTAGIFLALAAAAAVADWFAVARRDKRLEYVCKPLTLVLLVGVALALDPVHGDTRTWFVVALVCSLAGDVFLMLPREELFVFGLGSFLLGHVAYVIGFNLHGGSVAALLVAAVPVVVVATPLAVVLVRGALASGQREVAGPVVAYVVVIGAMVASALATGNVLAIVGALLFMVSDALIGLNRFVRPISWAPLAIIVTYHVAQAGLVLSLLR